MNTTNMNKIQLYAERAALAAIMLSMIATKAYAQGDLEPVQGTLDQLIQIFTGAIGTSLAVLAVIACGVLAWVGRMTWFFAGSIIMGIILVFGSARIVEFFKGAVGGT
jgi:type IV secretion system protein VirB2